MEATVTPEPPDEPQLRVELTLTMPAATWETDVREKLDALCAEYGIESRVTDLEPEGRT